MGSVSELLTDKEGGKGKYVNDRTSPYHPCLYKGLERAVVCLPISQNGHWGKEERDAFLLQLQKENYVSCQSWRATLPAQRGMDT